jgi:hypothetical protein
VIDMDNLVSILKGKGLVSNGGDDMPFSLTANEIVNTSDKELNVIDRREKKYE